MLQTAQIDLGWEFFDKLIYIYIYIYIYMLYIYILYIYIVYIYIIYIYIYIYMFDKVDKEFLHITIEVTKTLQKIHIS